VGRRASRTTPTGAVSEWSYDAAGNRSILTASGRTLAFTHDALGQELTRTLGDQLTLTSTWDPLGRLTAHAVTDPGAHPLQHRTYTYRADGGLTAIDDALNGPRRFTLDTAGRVTAVDARNWSETYAYDSAGNQTQASWPATMPGGQDATDERAYAGTRITLRQKTGPSCFRWGQRSPSA
jgi:YD repeat-containing protein